MASKQSRGAKRRRKPAPAPNPFADLPLAERLERVRDVLARVPPLDPFANGATKITRDDQVDQLLEHLELLWNPIRSLARDQLILAGRALRRTSLHDAALPDVRNGAHPGTDPEWFRMIDGFDELLRRSAIELLFLCPYGMCPDCRREAQEDVAVLVARSEAGAIDESRPRGPLGLPDIDSPVTDSGVADVLQMPAGAGAPLDYDAAAAFLGVSRRTLEQLVQDRELHGYLAGRRRLFRREELEEFQNTGGSRRRRSRKR